MCTVDFRKLNRQSPLYESFVISNIALSQDEPFTIDDIIEKAKKASVSLNYKTVETRLKTLTELSYLGRVHVTKFIVLKTTK